MSRPWEGYSLGVKRLWSNITFLGLALDRIAPWWVRPYGAQALGGVGPWCMGPDGVGSLYRST